ncbi:hypothetical protein [Sphingobacterium hungaricum]|uniref:5-bromo-4-chloroindolyl phosphate hydrolysis protein n=1 Tax=Sphingobacterium hungaricum TaxID=2082723 RepID=A0A928UTR7_9SPHI|nr:hypothetical protein [Sphingobacterium hungaricum]MBE8713191.1 hypothetical protein [Sphingobacterium hungaricum]
MGFATKKSRGWELRQLLWTFISIAMFIPLPVHIYPFVMLSQARQSKVRSWYVTGAALLMVELALFASFVIFWGAMSQAMILTLCGYTVSYIVGNGLLLNRSKPYLQRLELSEVRDLRWIPSIASQKRLELQAMTLDTPQLFIERLMHWRKEINNAAIHRNIDKIIHLFTLLEKNDKIEAEKFLVRHSTVVNVLMKYDEIENAKLNNSVTLDSKKKLEEVITQAAIAIEQEVTNQFQYGILDVSAESDVYIQTLKNRNLLKD